MQTSTPVQYSSLGILFKKFLHTKIGAFIGYHAGVTGFNMINATITRANGTVESLSPSYNSRVDVGAALSASLISATTLGGLSSPAAPNYIALSTSTLTPAHTDTTLTGETVVSGLARAVGAVGSFVAATTLDGAASYVVSKTFTAGAAGPTVIASAALFDAASTGNLFVEANLSGTASLALNDQLKISWTVNL